MLMMFKLIKVPVWLISIIFGLIGFIATLGSYAYVSDNAELTEGIKKNKKELDLNTSEIKTIKKDLGDYAKKVDLNEAITNHEKLHEAQDKNQKILLKYLDERFDSMEKLINKGK
jgi:hypothetical protein